MADLFERAARLLLGRGEADLDEKMEAEERRQREAGRPKPSLARVNFLERPYPDWWWRTRHVRP
jgi:hypothetical protein